MKTASQLAVFSFKKLVSHLAQLVSKFGGNLAQGLYHMTNIKQGETYADTKSGTQWTQTEGCQGL